MKKTATLLAAAAACALAACATQNQVAPGYDSDNFDNDIPHSEVPPKILALARAEIPGFDLEDAELVQRGATRLFELQGFANGRPHQIDITSDGRVLHIERD